MTLADRLYRHPYLYSGSVLAKACTLLGTIIWCGVVLSHPSALSRNPNYQHLLHIVGYEDAWGGVFLGVSLLLAFRLYRCNPPRWPNMIGYALLALLWTYLWWGAVINGQPWPAAASASSVMMVLSIYGFVSNPRNECPTCGGPRANGTCPLTGKLCGNARRYDEQRYQGD